MNCCVKCEGLSSRKLSFYSFVHGMSGDHTGEIRKIIGCMLGTIWYIFADFAHLDQKLQNYIMACTDQLVHKLLY